MKLAKDLFEIAIMIERKGVVYYTKLSESVKDPRGSSLFKYLAEQEREHERLFEEWKESFGDVEFKEEVPHLPVEEIFAVESLGEGDDIGATEHAIEVERKTADLYRKASRATSDDKLKEFLENLARVEDGHEKVLKENLESLKSDGAWQGYVPILEG